MPKDSARSPQSARWCFTINNYNQDNIQTLLALGYKFLCWGKEVAPTTGTPHLQGYVVFPSNKRATTMKKIMPQGTHFEVAKGSTEQNIEYCQKEGVYAEWGTRPMTSGQKGQTNAARFKDAFVAAKEGRLDDIPEDIRVRYYSTWNKIVVDYCPAPPDLEDTTGWWYAGPSGAGKSFNARINYPNAYMKMCNKWWDGYQGQDYVIIDDIDLTHSCLGHHLKIWTDRYAFLAESKGSAKMIRPKQIIITSQYAIEDIFEDCALREALNRRLKKKDFLRRPLGAVINAYTPYFPCPSDIARLAGPDKKGPLAQKQKSVEHRR